MRRRGLGARLVGWLVAAAALFLPRRKTPDEPDTGAPPAETVEREVGSTRAMENVVIAALLGVAVCAGAFMVLFVVLPDTQLLGLCLGLAFAFLAVAFVVAGKRLLPQETAVEEREDFGDASEREQVGEITRRGTEGVSRRGLIVGAAGTAGAGLGAALLFPASSLGPNVGDIIRETPWQRGRRVVDSKGRPLTADDIEEGTFHTGFPENASRGELGSAVIVVRVPPEELQLSAERRRFAPEGILAFSKICTHAGCAVSMYRHPLHDPTAPGAALVCPCHFSTFDVKKGAEVIFGPAARPLPQLPLVLNEARELVAAGDYFGQVGPSWEGVRT